MIVREKLVAAQRNRLVAGGAIDRDRPLLFSFGGRRMTGYAGDTLASALLANGVDVVGRSFKYARPRGILAAGVEEPNAIVQLGTGARTVPNVRATEQTLHEGLVARPVNGWPSAEHDAMGLVGRLGGAVMGPGFYYKTFIRPRRAWPLYERLLRRAAGLGRAPELPDPDRYEHVNRHVEVLIVGAGPTGLAAAREAARGGARVLLADERERLGGSLVDASETIDGRPAAAWVEEVVAELAARPEVTLLSRATVVAFHDHGFLTVRERLADHLGRDADPDLPRERLHRVRAASVVLATGAHERPLVYANNDVPGCMTASAVSSYIRRHAVVPGERLVVATANDGGYRAAFDWQDAGREVVAIVDARREPEGTAHESARERGLPVVTGAVVAEARGSRRVAGVVVAPVDAEARFVVGTPRGLDCDTVASSGGWSPAVHLACHTGSRPRWDERALGFVPGELAEGCFAGGSLLGHHALGDCLADGARAGREALVAALGAERAGGTGPAAPDLTSATSVESGATRPATSADNATVAPPLALFLAPHPEPPSRAPKQFVDYQNDVTAAAIEQSVREGFESIEHVKRYTALGFGTDQGKTGNVNGLAIVARALDRPIPEVGTTVFRPNYTPIAFGAVAGLHVDELFDPVRHTTLHAAHLAANAVFEDVGQWKRPRYFPLGEESMAEAIAREQLAVRERAGLLDASTLGKIDVQGRDAGEFLDRVYTGRFSTLAAGRCRYGLMCGEDGMILDDGVAACLAEDHFLVTTTTGGAARVLEWLESWLETEWPELDVHLTSVTEQWATLALAGPASRELLAPLTDIDLSAEAFAFMRFREGTVAGVPARVFRISFTGELSYEINVPAVLAPRVHDALVARGEAFGLARYGTETMHVLRAEKGYLIVGQDTDGSVTPEDAGYGWAVARDKPFSFLGERGMRRADCLRAGRKQLVGVETTDPAVVLAEGAQAIEDPAVRAPGRTIGHVTSSYPSATLGRSIALALIEDGRARHGERLWFADARGRVVEAWLREPLWVDPDGARLRG